MSLTIVLAAVVLAGGPSSARPAASEPLPSAQKVVARYLEAIGGKAALLRTRGLRAKGQFEIPAQAVSGAIEVLRARPNKQLVKVDLGTFGQMLTGFDGKTAWIQSPFTGPALLEGPMYDQAKEEANYYNQLHEKKYFSSMKTVARTEFDNRPCYQLELVWKSGRQTTEYFDVETGLLAGIQTTQASPQGALKMVLRMRDYKKFDGLQQSTRILQQLGDLEQTITLSTFVFESIPDSEFELPDEIKALVKEQAAK